MPSKIAYGRESRSPVWMRQRSFIAVQSFDLNGELLVRSAALAPDYHPDTTVTADLNGTAEWRVVWSTSRKEEPLKAVEGRHNHPPSIIIRAINENLGIVLVRTPGIGRG
jgi:hypothetical protein